MKKISLALTGLALSAVFALPSITHAEWWNLKDKIPCVGGCVGADPASLLQKVIGWVLGFAALIAVLFLIFGGILYIASAGNKERSEQAKKTILYAVIGLVVIVLSYFIVQMVINITKPLGNG